MEEMWVTKSGIKMKMSEMTDSHLINALNYCKRNKKEDPFNKLEKEAIIIKLIREAKRRKLNIDNIVDLKVEDEFISNRWEILDIR